MPTGYTAKLMESGQDFSEFALTCARAFGALIMMRDDDMDAPIPEFQPSDYNAKQVAEKENTVARLSAMTCAEQMAYGEAERSAAIARHREWLAREVVQNSKLDAMRAQVCAWEPPTPDHAELKSFMLNQLQISMQDTTYIERMIAEDEAKDAGWYYTSALKDAERGIAYNKAEHAKEVERTNSRNRWVRQLRESLMANA